MRIVKYFISVLFLATLMFVVIGRAYPENFLWMIPEPVAAPIAEPLPNIIEDSATSTINQLISTNPNIQASVSVMDITNGQRLNAGNNAEFTAASTSKVLSAIAYMHMVETGDATLDEYINGAKANSLIQRMLNQSDNDAWKSIDSHITFTKLTAYAHKIGLKDFDRLSNKLKSSDMAELLYKLHSGQLLSTKNRDLLYSFMQNTDNEDLIPPALPAGTKFYHKWGFLFGNLHDSAIIEHNNRVIILVIYTNDVSNKLINYDNRTKIIQEITKIIIKS